VPSYVIWDWNGTLIDDTWIGVQFMDKYLREHGCEPVSLAQYKDLVTFPIREFYRNLGVVFATDADYHENQRVFHEEYVSLVGQCSLHKGAVELLSALAAAGIRQAILSALSQDLLEDHVARFGVRHFFEFVSGGSNAHAIGKFDRAEEMRVATGCTPEELLLIGDTVHDADVAKHADIPCLLVANGYNSMARLSTCGFPVVEDLFQAAAWLGIELKETNCH
jgi:phosphoglycolate phosphatase